jgi:hypothetical protein
MPSGPGVIRPLDPAERYYWLLYQLSPMNLVAIAELDRTPTPDDLREALTALQRRHPLLRAGVTVVDGQLTFVESDRPLELHVVTDGPDWPEELGTVLDVPFDSTEGPLARFVYLAKPDSASSVLFFSEHHAIGDARAAFSVLQQVLRHVDGERTELAATGAVPGPLHEHFPAEFRSPRTAMAVVAAAREERENQDAPAELPFHARSAPGRITRLTSLSVEPEQVATLLQRTRQAGATVHGAVAAAVLEAIAVLFESPAERVLTLATPTDLRQRSEIPIPEDDVVLAIGLLCTPYVVAPSGDVALAQQITEQTRRELARGESHLFYRFARPAAYPPDPEGVEGFGQALAALPQNVAVSNFGVVGHEGDPSWLRSISVSLATSSNQLAFVTAVTYRGRLVINIATDRRKLAEDVTDRLLEGIADRIDALAN